MQGVRLRYRYDGPEAPWRATVDEFFEALLADAELKGRFSYSVAVGADGTTRVHTATWVSQEAAALIESRYYFQKFGTAIQHFAGDRADTHKFTVYKTTERLAGAPAPAA